LQKGRSSLCRQRLYSSSMAKNASRKHKPAAALKKARVISSKKAYVGPVFWVTTDHVLEPTGVRVRRDVVQHSGSVVVLRSMINALNREFCWKDSTATPLDVSCTSYPPGALTKARTRSMPPGENCSRKPGTRPEAGKEFCIFGPVRGSWPKPCLSIWPAV
jgi:hypothetical protein